MKGKLLVISGLSGAGKGTIANVLISGDSSFVLSISATSRDKREGEIDGKHYFFISKEKFLEMIENNEFLEYANYVGNYYGTPKKYVEEKLKEGKNVILEIEMKGALQIKNIYNDAVLVFFLPKDAETQEERLINRKRENKEQIKERILQAITDSTYAKYYDYVIVNDKIDDSIRDIKEVIDGNYDKNKNAKNLKILYNLVNEIKEKYHV